MKKKREMQCVVKQVSFKEAEEADDVYWGNASDEERLNELFELRKIFFGLTGKEKIKKVANRKSRYESD